MQPDSELFFFIYTLNLLELETNMELNNFL